jgi:hypothetical protein
VASKATDPSGAPARHTPVRPQAERAENLGGDTKRNVWRRQKRLGYKVLARLYERLAVGPMEKVWARVDWTVSCGCARCVAANSKFLP